MSSTRVLISGLLLLAWGSYLIFVYSVPTRLPGWALHTGIRRVSMLTRTYQPTVFTLLFGLAFVFLGVFGLVALIAGRGRDRRTP